MLPLIIAHRGASGYLPEHTLAAKRLAHEMGADFIEQDVVASRDDVLIVLHDVYLDRVTNVASHFRRRARSDGRFYVRDFDLEELRKLRIWERMNPDGSAVYPERYPARSGTFSIHTFAEEIELIQQLNDESGRAAGIYPEIKRPAWHRRNGVDLSPLILEELRRCGYSDRSDPVFVQCFDAAELVRLREDLGCPWQTIQLLGENDWRESETDYDALRSPIGLRGIAEYADGVGPWIEQLYQCSDAGNPPRPNGLVKAAQDSGLSVHPYTFRVDDVPSGFESFDDLIRFAVDVLGVDGLFTDFPDTVRRLLEQHEV